MSDHAPPPDRLPGMGLKRDTPDRRDRRLFATVPNVDALPPSASCSHLRPPTMDQKTTSACVGYSGSATFYMVMRQDGHRRPFVPSPVQVYREARVLGGYLPEDGGAEIRNSFKAANKIGLAPMSNIPPRFDSKSLADPATGIFPEDSIWRREPAKSHYADAERRQIVQYFRLDTLNDVLQCIADGWPVNFGFVMHRSAYGWNGPVRHIPDPGPNDRELGGHAVVGDTYDIPSRRIFSLGSWGEDAYEGHPDFSMSFDNFTQNAWDAWSCNFIEGGKVA